MLKYKTSKLHSLFFKLSLIFFGCFLALAFLISNGMNQLFGHQKGKNLFQRQVGQYLSYIQQDIGYSPTTEKIKEIENKLGIKIRIEKGERVLSGDTLPTYIEVAPFLWDKNQNDKKFKVGRYQGKLFLRSSSHGNRYVFFAPSKINISFEKDTILLLILGLFTILTVTYFLIRLLFYPLKKIIKGMDQVSKGELNYRIPIKSKDEFAQLAYTFNNMASKVELNTEGQKQILRDISHELKTPITRMRLNSEFIDDQKRKDSIREDLAEMDNLINAIIDGARLDKGKEYLKIQIVDPKKFFRNCIEKLKIKDEQITDLLEENTGMPLDLTWAERAIVNIVENAKRYSEISNIEVQYKNDDDFINVTVLDKGPGIAGKEIESIKEPFFRGDSSRNRKTGGFGLGLHITNKVMLAHGGELLIKNRVSGGLRVTLRFPRH